MKKIYQKFWSWYEKHLILNTYIAAALFTLQLIHLYWLTTDIVMERLIGQSFFNPGLWQNLILIVDYTEIPALLSTSLLYFNDFRKKANFKSLLYLLFINSQYLHIFWITDEFIIEQFSGSSSAILPAWLAWVAIGIDYLELPVIYETLRKSFISLKEKLI